MGKVEAEKVAKEVAVTCADQCTCHFTCFLSNPTPTPAPPPSRQFLCFYHDTGRGVRRSREARLDGHWQVAGLASSRGNLGAMCTQLGVWGERQHQV